MKTIKKLLAGVLSLTLVFSAAGVLAQQAPTQVKQPVQVAQGGAAAPSLFGLGPAASIAIMVVAVVAAAASVNDDNNTVTATATR